MMSQVIRRETVVFLMAVGHGAVLSLAYDLLRAWRRIIPHGVVSVSAEDFLFWLAAGFLTFLFLFFETDGEVRGYVAVGIGLGTALYLLCFSRLVIWGVTSFFVVIRQILSFLCRPFVILARKALLFTRSCPARRSGAKLHLNPEFCGVKSHGMRFLCIAKRRCWSRSEQ